MSIFFMLCIFFQRKLTSYDGLVFAHSEHLKASENLSVKLERLFSIGLVCILLTFQK